MKLHSNKHSTRVFIVGVAGILFISLFSSEISSKKILEHAVIKRDFENAKIANHDINENVLRLKTYLLDTYDPIVDDVAQLRLLCKNYKIGSQFEILRSGSTQQPLNRYCTAVENKADSLERFKSEHSILFNSIRFLPHLVTNFNGSQHEHKANAILANLLLYNLEPTVLLKREISLQLKELGAKKSKEKDSELIAALTLHANTILVHSELQQEVEEIILSPTVAKAQEKLEAVYFERYQASQKRSLFNYYGLIVICLCLAGWLVWKFSDVEKEVVQRTQQLSDAMLQLKESQQLVVQTTKMTALGEMAGGIAHEINTPLSAILLNAGVMLESDEVSRNPFLKKRIESIIKVVDRVAKIVAGLRRFSRNTDSIEKSKVSVHDIIEDTLTLCGEKLKSHGVEVIVDYSQANLRIDCVSEQISQVLMNFLNNSLDAMRETVPENRWIKIGAIEKDSAVQISVTDAGLGIPLHVQEKLMQPFFTTKPPGVGTGLGLSISKGIVEQHGGRLFYDPQSRNTRFVMQFPPALACAA